MKCPVCGNELKQLTSGSVTVDVCDGGCGGIWFDNFELTKFDEPNEIADALLTVRRDLSVKVDFEARRTCPRCQNIVMMRHLFSPNDKVTIDECPGCAGIWLDTGELQSIRNRFRTDEERDESTRKFLEEKVGPQLTEMAKESAEKLEKAKKFAQMFKLLCPSYYVEGKQDWGAF